ncbi:MAG: hypothetical protein H6618_07985 [Deltaproteobacteria bacterium]|nr:hypothetical protein [Deltaproteobacteria bacterium]
MRENELSLMYDLANFSQESMKWCSQESEKAAETISGIINILMDDADRVSAMSRETLDALQSMKDIVNALGNREDRDSANELALALKDSSSQDDEVKKLIYPILETLQFQDRISQNMGNMTKMVNIWIETRKKVSETGSFSEEEIKKFGQELLKCTTMNEEREIICQQIPGVEVEKVVTEDVLFF